MSELVRIPANRTAAAGHATLLVVAGIICGLPAISLWPRLHFVPNATSNRITDYAIAWLSGLLLICGIVVVWRGARWAVFAAWPGPLGFELACDAIRTRLGPFGAWAVGWSELSIEWPDYLFDLELDADEPLPMNECPPLRAVGGGPRIDVHLRRFGAVAEHEWWPLIEARVRPRLFNDPRWRT